MKQKIISCFFSVIFLVSSTIVLAQDLSVGRAKITFLSNEWTVATTQDQGLAYGGDVQGSVNAESKIFISKLPDGNLNAVIIARGSAGGINIGSMRYSPTCESRGTLFTDGNSGFNQTFAQCLKVYGFMSSQSLIKNLSAEQQLILKPYFANSTPQVRPIIAYYANSTGTFLQMMVLIPPSAAGISKEGLQGLKSNTNSDQSIVWGKSLMQAVKGSVMSLSGRLTFPSFETPAASELK